MSHLKQYALQYARLGMSIVPLLPREKYPGLKEWQNKATTDPGTIREWWTAEPESNIGFITGKRSGRIVVLDLDEHPEEGKFGIEIVKEWEAEHGKFPETWEAVTGSGGRHLYFRDTEDRLRAQHLYNGSVDFQSDSALIVLPHSVHPNGTEYYWDISPDDMPLADINENVLAFIQEGKKQVLTIDPGLESASVIPKGSRVSTMFRLVSKLIGTGMSEDTIRDAVRSENESRCQPPLTESELEKEVFPAIQRYKNPASSSTYYNRFRLPDIITGQAREDSIYRLIYRLKSMNCDDQSIFYLMSEENRRKCKPPLPDDYLERSVYLQALQNYKKGGRFNGRSDGLLRLSELSPFCDEQEK